MVTPEVKNLMKEFVFREQQMRDVYTRFSEQINKGLSSTSNAHAEVKCWITYIEDLPTGNEIGKYLVLKFNEKECRLVLVTLKGKGHHDTEVEIFPMPRIYTTGGGTGSKLFDFFAECLAKFIENQNLVKETLPLAFALSFPCHQQSLTKAKLVRWNKGFVCAGVVNEDVGDLLKKAIASHRLHVSVVAVLNDTSAILMECAYRNPNCRIGIVIGAGTNAGYVERAEKAELMQQRTRTGNNEIVVINTEWGAFGDMGSLDSILTIHDRKLDEETINKGNQIFEKMLSGKYLCELVRVILQNAIKKDLLFTNVDQKDKLLRILVTPHCITTLNICEIERDDSQTLKYTKQFLKELSDLDNVSNADCEKLKYIIGIVTKRAADLAAVCVSAMVNRSNMPKVIVGVEGYIYRYHPRFNSYMKDTMKLFVDPRIDFDCMTADSNFGCGAALIAALVTKKPPPKK